MTQPHPAEPTPPAEREDAAQPEVEDLELRPCGYPLPHQPHGYGAADLNLHYRCDGKGWE